MGKDARIVSQSAAVPYKITKKGPRILLVTSRRTKRWVLPKGMIDKGRSATGSAVVEAFEEAGVEGKISQKRLGWYDYHKPEMKKKAICRVLVFPFRVKTIHATWPEMSQRRRKWMTPKQAAQKVEEPKLKRILRKLGRELEKKAEKANKKK